MFVRLLLSLIVAHFALDYPLQGDTTAREKNPNSLTELQKAVPWYYWMTAHASMHAAAVTYFTDSLLLGGLEFAVHFATDYAKCQRRISIHADQGIHILTKVLIALVYVWGR